LVSHPFRGKPIVYLEENKNKNDTNRACGTNYTSLDTPDFILIYFLAFPKIEFDGCVKKR
jgi:hypothetical protein